ncbi:hypothetical protein F7Q99_38745 [Streptomyces kaniharaensis]|uniref:Uncharacterized protein n=1 Tax=Streptomyces kaniharaensis TaxID=212423 RepID=A0A6N7L6V9_9ACTN|nr:hypothetical protein [Streptomyces kaniharaensis]MQS16151.1 hypothetical protein [Streptomyces kaniharaensis]MQS17930.1 hypothetical protein [Streptomyces kaniharaensis]MQS17973.1 hypothetical protein [Streptomyces kaniharaensis]
MGFSGSFVVARAEQPVTELAAVQALAATSWWSARDGAWQILQLSPGVAPHDSIATETGAPALVMYVHDSDVVSVEAASPGGLTWHCALSPEMARDYDVPEEWIGDPDEVTRQAVAWAEAAGLQPDPVAVRTTLEAECDPLAEGLVLDLVHALGFRFGDGESLITCQ